MARLINLSIIVLLFSVSPAFGQKRVKPDINESKEFSDTFHSPSADATPDIFHSIFQMEIVVNRENVDAEVIYSNGTVVSKDVIITVVDCPKPSEDESSGIESATVLMLDGAGIPASLVKYAPAYGIAIFRVKGLESRPLQLSKASPVANRRINWHAIFKNGRKTYLYTRPLRVHKSRHRIAETADLCQIIDPGTSSLNADRSGSALVSLDGTLLGVMGRQEHWIVTPKNSPPRKKLAWAVPAHVLARLLE